ncbi:hypothetical protein [Spirosoma aureum]|nr:hypothetical protein [Spirosoma aureum]
MKTFFAQFTKPGWERYRISPAANIERLPKQDSEMHEPYNEVQTAEIIGRILEKKDYYLLLYIYFIHYTFARPGREVRLLKVGDLKLSCPDIGCQFSSKIDNYGRPHSRPAESLSVQRTTPGDGRVSHPLWR